MSNIIQLLEQRNQKGLSLLYDRYGPTLFGIIVRITGNKGLAEEILQQTFLSIWNNFGSYNSERGSLYTWMATVARNKALDEVRLKRHKFGQDIEQLNTQHLSNEVTTMNTDKMDTSILMSILTEKNREVLDMVYLKGYSQADTAKALDIPLGTVKSRIRLAIGSLREFLKEENEQLFASIIFIIILLYWLWM